MNNSVTGVEKEIESSGFRNLASPPFKSMKKNESSFSIHDFTDVVFPDGKTKLVTCSFDRTLQIIDLETLECEKKIEHSTLLLSVHFYKEEQVLMATSWNGDIVFWNIFSPEIKMIRKIEVARKGSLLIELTKVSSKLFVCCVSLFSNSLGCLFSIKFNKNIKSDIEVKEIKYPLINKKKEPLECIYKLIKKKTTILFSGGSPNKGGDNTIKKYDFETKKFFRFSKKHSGIVNCLTSYINEQNEEIILSGSKDKRIMFWKIWNQKNGVYLKEIKLNYPIYCFLEDYRRNNIFIAIGHFPYYSLHSFNFRTKKMIKSIEKIHKNTVTCMKWINEEKSKYEKFISSSDDKTFNIYKLEEFQNKFENEDLRERISFIRDEKFFQEYFCLETNKKMILTIKLVNSFRINNNFKVFFDL